MYNWQFKTFNQLTNIELFRLLELRTNVFVVEQNCPYPELDDADLSCTHLLLKNEQHIIGTARIFPIENGSTKIGRVCIHENYRGKGLAHSLMIECLQFIQQKEGHFVKISAQSHLEELYHKHGFIKVSEEYLEDNIPHIEMHLTF